MKTYFVNPKNKKNTRSTELIKDAVHGKYGIFAKIGNGICSSQKKMESQGWSLIQLTASDAVKLVELEGKRKKRLAKEYNDQKLKERAEQINICLSGNPLKLEENKGGNPFVATIVNLADTHMIEAYHGCGKGTAYVNDSGDLVAFHYGYDQPENAPELEAIEVEFSGTQICF